MSEQISRRQQLEEARLRHQLELQSQQIERVFDHHRLVARVEGGRVNPQAVSFDLQTQLASGWEKLRRVKQDLTTALGVSSVQLNRENGSWRLQVARPDVPPVALLDLLSLLDDVPTATAVLGLAENGQPVLLNFLDPNTRHVLLAGSEKAGKTALLRSIALSLVLHNRQAQLQLLAIDVDRKPKEQNRTLEPLNYLPHLLQDVIRNGKMAEQALAFLCEEMVHRQDEGVVRPTIIVLIDNIVALLRLKSVEITDCLIRLLQYGSEAGIHLVLGTRRPEAPELNDLRKVDLPVRLVGRVYDAYEAQAAADIPRSRAEYLLGEGDFLAILDGMPLHFQAAFASDYDIHLSLRQLLANKTPRLLAQPFVTRPALPAMTASTSSTQAFALDDSGAVSLPPLEEIVVSASPYQPTPSRMVSLIQELPAEYVVVPESSTEPVVEPMDDGTVEDESVDESVVFPEALDEPVVVQPDNLELPFFETPEADEGDILTASFFEAIADEEDDVVDLPFFEEVASEETAVKPPPPLTDEKPKISLKGSQRRASIPFLDDLDDDVVEDKVEEAPVNNLKPEKTKADDSLSFLDELGPLKPKSHKRRPIARRRPLKQKGANE